MQYSKEDVRIRVVVVSVLAFGVQRRKVPAPALPALNANILENVTQEWNGCALPKIFVSNCRQYRCFRQPIDQHAGSIEPRLLQCLLGLRYTFPCSTIEAPISTLAKPPTRLELQEDQ